MTARLLLRSALALALLAGARSAHAAPTASSFDVERLWLDPSARGSLVVGDGETLPSHGFRLALGGGFERRPLVTVEQGLRGRGIGASGKLLSEEARDRWTMQATLAGALTDRFELGLRAPVTLNQNERSLPSSADYNAWHKQILGTFTAMARYGLTQQAAGSAVSSALAVDVGLPIYQYDEGSKPIPLIAPRLEVGKRMGSFLLGGNVGAVLRPHQLDLPGQERLRHEITAAAVAATTGGPLRYELSARGATNFDGLGAHGEVLGGVRCGLSWAELFALAGPGFFSSPGTPTWRAFVGLALFTPAPAAAPPPAPAPEPEPVAAPAPPPPPPDPCAAGQAHTPEQCPDLDDDGDGIPNGQDKCPTVKGIAELQGCPAVDTDGDGVADHLDKCPTVPGLAEFQGCPPPDRDGDGIADPDDKCPDQPGLPELQGCPPSSAEIKAGKIDIHEKVFFDTSKATIQPRSFALLDDVSKLVVANPQVGKIRVEGHTDNRGGAALNRKLSQARAEAVRDYLVAHGVPADRLEAEGFGPDRPAQPNTSAAGREANRRVEFSILGVNE